MDSNDINDVMPPKNDGSPLDKASRERSAERAQNRKETNIGPRNTWLFAAGFAVFAIATMWLYFSRTTPIGNKVGGPSLGFDRLRTEFFPKIQSGVGAYKGLTALSGSGIAIVEDFGTLTTLLPDLFAHRKGTELLALLKRTDANLGDMQGALNGLDVSFSELESQLPFGADSALSFRLQILQAKQLLELAIPWLENKEPHHIAVFFANTSELRPTGGFLGSYADLVIADASLASYTVHDINDIDRVFKPNIIPPVPLQTISKAWRIADANWFFDVPTSASKVLDFMDMSDLSKASGTRYEGALFISPRVVGDLLALTGPIELSQASMTITADNFLEKIQSQVQAGQQGGDPHPKKILSELAPLLLAKMLALTEQERSSILDSLWQWVTARDLLVYARNSELQGMLDHYGISGKAYALQENFQGDYLAVVHSNIGGGKTDIFMDTDVVFQSEVGLDGTVSNHLTVSRTHVAPKTAAWWYRVPNIDYQMIHTGDKTTFVYGKSSLERHVKPPINYKRAGYQVDPDVAAFEGTAVEIPAAPAFTMFSSPGKNIFATWSKTNPDKTSTTTLDYTRRLPDTLGNGSEYTFVLERQQGDEGRYRISIVAPTGYIWKEINLPVYIYKDDGMRGRMTVTLTLEKL